MVDLAELRLWLVSVILKVFSNLNISMTLRSYDSRSLADLRHVWDRLFLWGFFPYDILVQIL